MLKRLKIAEAKGNQSSALCTTVSQSCSARFHDSQDARGRMKGDAAADCARGANVDSRVATVASNEVAKAPV